MKFYKSKLYWYSVYVSTLRPFIQEKVESTDNKWDDALLEAFDYIFNKLVDPQDEKRDD